MQHPTKPRYLRERQLVGNKRAVPPEPGMLPFSAATLWRKVKLGEFPAPVKLGPAITAWRVADVERWMASCAGEA